MSLPSPGVSVCLRALAHVSSGSSRGSGAPPQPGRSPSEGALCACTGPMGWGKRAPLAAPSTLLGWTHNQCIAETLRGWHHVMDGPCFPGEGWQSCCLQTNPGGPNATATAPRNAFLVKPNTETPVGRETSGSSGRGLRTQVATCEGSGGNGR